MNDDMRGLRVMVTAGASGIGLSIAQAFANAGACVQISDVAADKLDAALLTIPGGGGFAADAANPEAVDAWFSHALSALGGLDVLVNNAGVAGPTARIEEIELHQWDETLAINLRSQYLCTRRAIPALRASRRACIINMSSVAGRLGYPLRTPYAASKWAVIGLTQSLAMELGEDDITVNAILPGIVDSERSRAVTAAKAHARQISEHEMQKEILANVSLHRKVPLSDVAGTALFLASDVGRSFTGQSLNVCAGIQSLR